MNDKTDNRILARISTEHFVGREHELARIAECASASAPVRRNRPCVMPGGRPASRKDTAEALVG